MASAVAVLLPERAHAHLRLERAIPATDARLTAAPDVLRLAFSQPIELAFARVSLVGPAGEVELAPLTLAPDDERVLVTPIEGALDPGTYSVRWQVAGPDGHPVRGEYAFVIEPGASGLATAGEVAGSTAPGRTAPPPEHHTGPGPEETAFDAGSPLYAAVRWLTFVGLLGTIGAVAFGTLVLRLAGRHLPESSGFVERAGRRAAGFGLGALALLAIALLLRLYAQSVALQGPANALDVERIGVMLSRTLWGWGWLLQAAGILVVLGGLGLALRNSARGWALALLGAAALAFTPALSGHAIAAQELTTLAVTADGLHVFGAGGWLGSLLVIVAVGIPLALSLGPEQRGATVGALINAFSPTALAFAGLVVATGLFSAYLHLGSVSALWESAYGRTLLLKLGILTVVFGTGAYNWLRVKPSLGTERAATHLRRSASLELVVGVLVLAVTAVLVATPPPADMEDVEIGASARTSDLVSAVR